MDVDKLDAETIEKLDQVDWQRVPIAEAKEFGLSSKYYKDAMDHVLRAKSANKENWYDTIVVSSIVFSAAAGALSLTSVCGCIALYTLLKVANGLSTKYIANRALENQHQNFHEELDEIVNKYGKRPVEHRIKEEHVPYVKKT